MSFNYKDTEAYRRTETGNMLLSAKQQREELLKPYLPSDRNEKKQPTTLLGRGRRFLKALLFLFSYNVVHTIFSLYIRMRIWYHQILYHIISLLKYHHRTPDYIRQDVSKLKRLPTHVSIILTLEEGGSRRDAKEKLIKEIADVAAWCASAGINMLSVYERTGILKGDNDTLHRTQRNISHKLQDWFGRYQAPDLHLHCPNMPVVHPPYYQPPSHKLSDGEAPETNVYGVAIMLISEEDGRESMVDLTKVLAEMAQAGKIKPDDITSDVVDNELTKAVMAEPDLLISFSPYVDLQGYPPWQIRLTEIYCQPDNQEVGYQVFLAALRKYAAATFKLGK